MIDVHAARVLAEQARTAYEDAACAYAVRLSQVAALLVRAQMPTAAVLVFDKDEQTVTADTTIEIVSVRGIDGAALGELDWSTSNEVCGLIRTAYDSADGFYPTASQDTYDTESVGGEWQDRNLLELHIDETQRSERMKVAVTTRTNTLEIALGNGDDFAIISVDGKELVGIFADSGAGWYPHGDGGEHFGDWTPLVAKDIPAQCSSCDKPATREIFPDLDDEPGSALYCDDCQPATIGDIRPLEPNAE